MLQPLRVRTALFLAALAAPALAQNYAFQIDPASSTTHLTSTLTLEMPGTLIGNWDATNNPTGTRTLPGLFGGSGNQPVPMTLTPTLDSDLQGSPAGIFSASVDFNALTIDVSELDLDPLGGIPGQSNLTVDFLFSTFRTFQPDSVFFGGIPLPIPLGQVTVSDVRFVQNGASTGGVLSMIGPGFYDVSVVVPVDLSFTVDLLGQVTQVGPLPIALPFVGTFAKTPNGAVVLLGVDSSANQTTPDPFPGTGLTDFPFDVPTILPPGGTAHLLLNATIAELAVQYATQLNIVAQGPVLCSSENYCIGAPNSTGVGAHIQVRGSSSLSKNDLTLAVTDLPPFKKGVFLFGQFQAQVPFGDGYACIGDPIFRGTVARADSNGTVAARFDEAAYPPGAGSMFPGAQVHFQFWYRDPHGGPAGFNLSDAMQVTFCP
jgi:hypothetical protein